jgi:hypothetical protein
MRAYLEESNQDLLYQIAVVQELLGKTSVCGALTPYVGQVIQLCEALCRQAQRNLTDLGYGLDDTLNDILAATQGLTNVFEVVNTRLAAPVVRARPEDRLGLLVLRFLHDSNPMTAALPFGLSDGSFAVYPTDKIPPIYLVPTSRQTTLLYLPLLFHEFGHLLYACHKEDMDDLVKELQKIVAAALAPKSVRSRAAASRSSSFRKQVVTAWYTWAQEFYCDAVGITVGGPCFLKAFSHFFRTRSNDQYYVPRDEQLQRRHPVTWLRTKMLVDRARKYGLHTLADTVQDAWAETAVVLGIQEDYEGTWSDDFLLPLRQMLDDMIENSPPYAHQDTDVNMPAEPAKRLSGKSGNVGKVWKKMGCAVAGLPDMPAHRGARETAKWAAFNSRPFCVPTW